MGDTVPAGKANVFQSFTSYAYDKRSLIWQLAKSDFQKRHAGSLLGVVWIFMHPIAMMLILWFVFSFGLKSQPSKTSIPFVAWFFPAMIAWNYFSDAVIASTGVFHEYSFLVKKVKFQIALLPFVKILTSTLIHLIFMGILVVILLFSGVYPSLHWLQIIYYFFACVCLLIGVAFASSAINVFMKDLGHVMGILMQFGFWLTPIIWDIDNVPEQFRPFVKLNPMYYIISGYRSSFLNEAYFWEFDIWQTAYFWLVTFAIFVLGLRLYWRLRPNFADVL